jgi:Predicted membrane protein (DUF2207)
MDVASGLTVSAPNLALIALVAAPVALWFVAYGLTYMATRPDRPDPAPATEDLGSEPPAMVSLLVNRWEITEDAAESTLIDLAARHILEFRQPANDPLQTTVHVREPDPTGLNPYEQRVFDRLGALAKGGVVPLTALTFRDPSAASAWAKRLAAEVIADARSRGLSRRRFGRGLVGALGAAAIVAAVVEAIAVSIFLRRQHGSDSGHVALWVGVVTFGVLSAIGGRAHGERDTPAGREACARWLGVRAWLRAHEAFADLPPAAVTVWDRYLSYGAAVGATRVSSAVIDLGMGNRKRVWSSYAGSGAGGRTGTGTGTGTGTEIDPTSPSWHRVRVYYPRFWPRYGKTAPRIVVRAIIAAIVGVLLIHYWYHAVGNVFSDAADDSAGAGFGSLIKGIGLLVGVVLLAYGIYAFVRTIIDLAAPRTITGEVVWREVWRSTTHDEQSVPVLHYLAIDGGTGESTRAWALPNALGHTCDTGDVVTAAVRPWSRRVLSVDVVSRGAATRLPLADPVATSGNIEDMITAAMGIPSARSSAGENRLGPLGGLLGPAIAPTGPLLTPDEVGSALGRSVTVRHRTGRTGPTPFEVNEFTGMDGSVMLTVMRSGGTIGRMAMRANQRQSQPLTGIGDEARAGAGWVAVRRGADVLLLRLGPTVAATPPVNLASLANTAVNRLPATVTPGS